LRILHLSDGSLPDWRIEKSAITASNVGHEIIFAGRDSGAYERQTFSKTYKINWNAKARLGIPFYWHSVKKQFARVLKEVKPDVIHAHNIFSAKMISEFGLPLVYDDHEYWSEYPKVLADRYTDESAASRMRMQIAKRVKSRLIIARSIRLWTKWEKEIVSSYPTITVSDKIAEELRAKYHAQRVFVVPNYPMKSESKHFEKPQFHSDLSCVYAGTEPLPGIILAQRNIVGLIHTFSKYDIGNIVMIGICGESCSKVKYTGFLSRQDMFKEMFGHSIGLIPWKRHWSHVFVNPNKAYEYAHAGLFVMCTSSFKVLTETLKEHCITFEDYEDMASKLIYLKENLDDLYRKRRKIFNYARDKLIWEENERNIIAAYNIC
jgi:glycosyltransferase involved in cell wall biosynthesis